MDPDIEETVGEANDSSTDAEYLPDEEDALEESEPNLKPGEFAIWKFFKRVHPVARKRAKCCVCREVYSYKSSSTNLKMHLKRHPRAMKKYLKLNMLQKSGPKRSKTDDATAAEVDIYTLKQAKFRDPTVWKYFEIVTPNITAKCNYCLKVLSYRTSITNLKKHLAMKHPQVANRDQQLVRRVVPYFNLSQIVEGFDENGHYKTNTRDEKPVKDVKPRAPNYIWKYFEKVMPFDDKMAKCRSCHKKLSYKSTVSNLKVHMAIKHYEVIKYDANFANKDYLFRKGEPYEKKISTRDKKKMFEMLEMESDNDDVQNDTNDSESDKRTTPNNKYKKIASKIDVTKLFRIDDSRKVAKCGLCSQEVHFTKTYAEMKYHVIKVHGDDEVQDSSTLDEEGTKDYTSDGDKERVLENDSEQSENKKSCRRSNNWKYFELVDEVNKIARCNTCGRELSYSTVSNLKKHLVRMHSDKGTLAEFACSPELKSKHVPNKIKPQSRFRSSVWKFFDVVDEKAKIATCRLCANKFSYNCLSNIWKHLTRMHNGEFSSSDEEGEAEVLEEQNSPVWAYFKCLSQDLKIASCLICKKRVDYNDTRDLSKHLSRKHPQVQVDLDSQTTKPKKLMITGNGDIYEIDEEVVKEEPVNVQEVKDNGSDEWPYNVDETDALDTSEYLDENIFNDPPVPTKKRRQSYKRVLNREDDRSHVTTQKSSLCEESSLDIFGKYMVSLLKKLPKHKSDQLQVDFVRQIMEAQNDSDITRSKNTRSLSSIKNTHTQNTIDDTRVTSNSEVQRVITHDGEIQHVVLGNEQIIVTSAGDEIKVRTTE